MRGPACCRAPHLFVAAVSGVACPVSRVRVAVSRALRGLGVSRCLGASRVTDGRQCPTSGFHRLLRLLLVVADGRSRCGRYAVVGFVVVVGTFRTGCFGVGVSRRVFRLSRVGDCRPIVPASSPEGLRGSLPGVLPSFRMQFPRGLGVP